MAAYDLEEQEQISQLKHWWEQYGNLVTWVLLAVAVAVVAYQGWNWYQRKQSLEASVVYGALQKAAAEKDIKKARDAAGELLEKYSGTAYAALGALVSAKVQVEGGDLKTARAQLAWAAGNAKTPELRDLARLRLAAVLLDDQAPEEALKQLEQAPTAPFAPRFAELRGDILAIQGKRAEARSAYQAALAQLDVQAKSADAPQNLRAMREVVQLKLESLGEGQ